MGNTVLRRLRDRSATSELLTLVRRQPDEKVFADVDAELVMGELGDETSDETSADSIDRAVASCDCVIHSAALIHIGWRRLDESLAVNRDGTEAIAKACLKHGVPIVYIGTVDTLAVGSRAAPATETTPIGSDGGKVPCSYVVSKRAGVDVIRRLLPRGLKAVVVHPGFMLGPWDWKPSSGRMIREVARVWRPIAPAGGCSVCDSRDVADGTIAAMEAVISGEIENGREYILAGENWTYMKLWTEITRRTGTRGPVMPAGPGQQFIGEMAAKVIDRWSRTEGDFNSAAIKLSSQYHWYDSTRARTELGYRNRDIGDTLDEAVDWVWRGVHPQKSGDF